MQVQFHEVSLVGNGTGPQFTKHFSCSTHQMSMKFQLLIKTKMMKNKDFSCLKLADVVFIIANKC